MSCRHTSRGGRGFWIVVLSFLFLLGLFPREGGTAESGTFRGTWIANGTREVFPFSDDRKISTFKLSGHVNLQTSFGKTKDYWSDCVGLTDTVTGVVARCVWKDLDGTNVYITLQSESLGTENKFSGVIIGGSGPLQGITGDLSFTWSSFVFQRIDDQSTVTGQTLDLHGNYQVP